MLHLTCRQEARRRLGNTGKVFLDVGSDEEEEDVQLQPPAGDGCARRVTFSAAGASAEELRLQPGPEVGTSALLHASRWALGSCMTGCVANPGRSTHRIGAAACMLIQQPVAALCGRLWRGAAASLCAGRLQSLERHAADLKQRQEVHTELKAWVDQVLSQHQGKQLLQLSREDSGDSIGWQATHSDTQHQQPSSHQHQHDHQEPSEPGTTGAHEGGASQRDSQHRRRNSSHRHRHRRHHRHHHAAADQLEAAAQQGAGSDEAAVTAAEAAGVAADGPPTVVQQLQVTETMAMLRVQQVRDTVQVVPAAGTSCACAWAQ